MQAVEQDEDQLYAIIVRLEKFHERFDSLGSALGKDQYFVLINLQATMHNIIQDQLTKVLTSQLRKHGLYDANVGKFDFASLKSVEARFKPQTNIRLPYAFRLFLMQYLEVAFEYEELQNAMERMSYYCIAREPWLLDEYEINPDPEAVIDDRLPRNVIYEMLRAVCGDEPAPE